MRLAGEGSAADTSCSGETYPRSDRLRRRPDFLRVQREGARVHTPHYVVVVQPRPEGDEVGRLGITVTKKVANAVGRNRVKRVVREVYRKNRDLFPKGCDIVVMAKSGAPDLGYHAASAELAKVAGPLARAARGAKRRSPPRPSSASPSSTGER